MIFAKPLERWKFSKREKRFFIYGQAAGQTAHCANTGSMKGLLEMPYVWVTDLGEGHTGKLRYKAELAELVDGTLAVINTAHANVLAGEALRTNIIPNLGVINNLQHEVKYSAETRFDWAYDNAQGQRVWVEVKNVTMGEGSTAAFPDAVTTRGTKHLQTLTEIVRAGGHALQIYMVARSNAASFRPATEIDPAYTQALKQAVAAGVQVVALGCTITPQRIDVCKILPVVM